MIFIDTNYFLRFLLEDNLQQQQKVKQLFKKAITKKIKLFTSTIVIFEIFWVLSSFYKKNKQEVIRVLDKILALTFIELEERQIIQKALNIYSEKNLDFEDCYNLSFAKNSNAKKIATFDKKLEKAFS